MSAPAGVIGDAKDSFPNLSLLCADGGYAGNKLELEMLTTDGPDIEIVRYAEGAKGFVVIAWRWVAKNWENSIASAEARTLIASVRRLCRRIARQSQSAVAF